MNDKKKSRTKYAIKNVTFNFIYQVLNTIVNIIVPPLIITKYGSIINGLRSTLKQIISYIQLVGAGIAESTTVALYKPLADKDEKRISSIYNASSKAFNNAGIIFSLISIMVASLYPFFIEEDLNYWFIFGIILILCISAASEFFVLGRCRTLLTADQKVYIINIAQIIGSVVSTIVTIVFIKLNFSILIVELATSLTYIMRVVILIVYVSKKYKFIDKKVEPDISATSKRKDATIHQLASLIIFGSQTIFIAKFCGLVEVSVYSVYNLIFVGINTILSTISSAILPGFGNIIAVESKEKLRKTYNLYEYAYYILVFVMYTITYIMIMPFIKIYTSGATDANYIRMSLVVLFSIMGILNCLRTPGATLINASGHYKETKNRAIIEMIICVIGQLIFVSKLGISGIIIGTTLAYIYRSADVIIYSHKKILFNGLTKTITRILFNVIIMIGLVFIQDRVFDVQVSSYIQWILYAIPITLTIAVIYIILNFVVDRKTFDELKQYVYMISRRGEKVN